MVEELCLTGYRQRLKLNGHQDKLDIEQSVKDGFNLHFKGIAAADVNTVLNTMSNSFNICSILIQKSKRVDGGTA